MSYKFSSSISHASTALASSWLRCTHQSCTLYASVKQRGQTAARSSRTNDSVAVVGPRAVPGCLPETTAAVASDTHTYVWMGKHHPHVVGACRGAGGWGGGGRVHRAPLHPFFFSPPPPVQFLRHVGVLVQTAPLLSAALPPRPSRKYVYAMLGFCCWEEVGCGDGCPAGAEWGRGHLPAGVPQPLPLPLVAPLTPALPSRPSPLAPFPIPSTFYVLHKRIRFM